MPRYFKVTGPAGECLNGGNGAWPIPSETEPGAWRTVEGPIVACRNGLHLAAAADLAQWLPSDQSEYRVWLAETGGELVEAPGKVAVRSARLLREVNLGAYNAARAAVQAAYDTAGLVQDRARMAASSRYDRVRGAHYIAMISARGTLPAGHPLAAKAIAYAIVEAKARKAYDRALKRAALAYQAELAPLETALERALEGLA